MAQIQVAAAGGLSKIDNVDAMFGFNAEISYSVAEQVSVGLSVGSYTMKESIPFFGTLRYSTTPILAFGDYRLGSNSDLVPEVGLGFGALRQSAVGISAGYFSLAPRVAGNYSVSDVLGVCVRYSPVIAFANGESLTSHIVTVGASYRLDL